MSDTERPAREALDNLVFLKNIKERMEAGTATDVERQCYAMQKEPAWAIARRVLDDDVLNGHLQPIVGPDGIASANTLTFEGTPVKDGTAVDWQGVVEERLTEIEAALKPGSAPKMHVQSAWTPVSEPPEREGEVLAWKTGCEFAIDPNTGEGGDTIIRRWGGQLAVYWYQPAKGFDPVFTHWRPSFAGPESPPEEHHP